MPLAAGAATLGVALAAAAGSPDPVGIACWTSIGAAVCSGLPACFSAFDPTAGETPMVVAAGVVAPSTGGFTKVPAGHLALGAALAAASLSVDPVGLAKWLAVAKALVDWCGSYMCYGPSGLAGYAGPAPPPAGPLTGTGKVTFLNDAVGPKLAEAAGSTDAAGIAKWTAIGAAIIASIKANGAIAPAALQNPAAGGPVTGTGTFS